MIIVENDPVKVETDLAAGVVGCPVCGGRLARWGWARRRWLRGETGPVGVRPRRGRCVSCLVTQVFLPDVALVRRVDGVAVIGRALMAAAAGAGHRRVAAQLDRPASTVRGWLRRFRLAALRVAAHFVVWA
ncbi:MAG: helix-turn-helix domain-containing protein, partial [Actinomycetota bacterium]|nr:helix-turn-helix domain-containing protein [Actinomycetota bacterium]